MHKKILMSTKHNILLQCWSTCVPAAGSAGRPAAPAAARARPPPTPGPLLSEYPCQPRPWHLSRTQAASGPHRASGIYSTVQAGHILQMFYSFHLIFTCNSFISIHGITQCCWGRTSEFEFYVYSSLHGIWTLTSPFPPFLYALHAKQGESRLI